MQSWEFMSNVQFLNKSFFSELVEPAHKSSLNDLSSDPVAEIFKLKHTVEEYSERF